MKSKYLLFFLCTILLASCKFVKPFFIKNEKKEERKEKREEKKEVRKDKVNTAKMDSAVVVKKDTLHIPKYDTLLARKIIDKRKIDYDNIQLKAKMHFESGTQKQNFTANFRIKKDQIIWVSIQVPLIGEVARAVITPDSVQAIEKINKKYYRYSYKDIQKIINIEVDFRSLQEIIIGNAIADKGAITDIVELGDINMISIKGEDYTNQLSYSKIDTTLKQIQLQIMRAVSASSIMMVQSQFQKIEKNYFATQREYHVQDVKGAAFLDMDITKIEFDKNVDFPFKIPANYKLQKN